MDGSALPFIYLLQKGGIEEQNAAKRFIRIKEKVRIEEGDKWAELEPYDGFHIDFEIAFDHLKAIRSPTYWFRYYDEKLY